MTDIVVRLRDWTQIYPEDAGDADGILYGKAADEIERLRAALHIIAWEGYEDHDFQRIARAALGGDND